MSCGKPHALCLICLETSPTVKAGIRHTDRHPEWERDAYHQGLLEPGSWFQAWRERGP